MRVSPQSARAFRKPGVTRTRLSSLRGVGIPEEQLDRSNDFLDGFAEIGLAPSLLEVGRPLRVERLGLAFDLNVTYDGGIRGFDKRRSFSVLGGEGPLSRTDRGEVFSLYPAFSLVRMTTSGPVPRHLPDAVVDPFIGLLGHDVPMEISPPPDDRIQRFDQILLACGFRFPKDVPDFRQEGLDVLLRWLDQELAILVLSDFLSQENEPYRDMDDAGLLLRELQSAFLQELCDEGSDFLLEEVFRRSCDDEVIGISN